ncbi:MAG: BaiN/RdsA family NAD(P)/FAD-dependent oxidoreductase [Armatimonadota bacterium]
MRVVVIGAGAGGMLAAGRAAECGAKAIILERGSVPGRKLAITGKGRCNLTNTAEIEEMVASFGANGKFLYGAFSRFSNEDVRELLDRLGVPTKVERGGRVFPVSDSADDVVDALMRWLRELGVEVRTGCRAQGLVVDGRVTGVTVFGGTVPADAVVLATGGITYPKTGSTGDGYRMAAEVGHTIVPPKPSLAALETREKWVSDLSGLSLKNVTATMYANGKKVAREFGEMLFTHFGISGPIILTLSKTYAGLEGEVQVGINLKPALTREQVDARLVEGFAGTRQFKNYLSELLPRTLIPIFAWLSGIPEETPTNRITAKERRRIVDLLFDLRLTVARARAADEGIVTAGGVSVKEIDPRTMQSKLVPGLYFAGEVIDIDAVTGGYNLQAAFSTGWVAGESAASAGIPPPNGESE